MAQSVTQKLIGQAGLTKQIQVDSAGTHAHHSGEKPDPRALAVLKQKGYEAGRIRSRRIVAKDFVFFDAIFAMDASNLADLKRICPPEHLGKLKLFLHPLEGETAGDVPDPYFGNLQGFERVLSLCEAGAKALVKNYTLK